MSNGFNLNNGHAVKNNKPPIRTKGSSVTLSLSEYSDAGRWVEGNWESLKTSTREAAVERLAEHLKKPVNWRHFVRVLDDVVKREWPGLRPKKKSRKGGGNDRVRILAMQMMRFMESLEWIEDQLGVRVPEDTRPDMDTLKKLWNCEANIKPEFT